MLFLCLAIFSSAAISLLMRLSANKVTAKMSMLGINYLVCAILAAGYAGFDFAPATQGLGFAVGIGAVSGLLYLSGFVLFGWNTAKNGIVLSSVFMKLGLLVPLVCSVVIFRETPGWLQAVGFVAALAAIVMLNWQTGEKSRFCWQLPAMLFVCGGADVMSKVFETYGDPALSEQYLFYTFLTALCACWLPAKRAKETPGKWEWLYGVALGIPNFFSAKFLLLALTELPSVVVFPSFSIATMLITTVLGVVLFKERLRKWQWVAVAIILAALLLLNI